MLLRKRQNSSRAAFTLMEIIVVVTIIMILAGSSVFVYQSVLESSKESRALLDVKSIEKAAEVYNLRFGQYPGTVEVLCQRMPDNSTALLDQTVLVDPWGNHYVIEPGNLHNLTGKPHVYSQGPPGKGKLLGNWPGEDGKGAR
jgi:type II secretory pathway pseudopilin PulG